MKTTIDTPKFFLGAGTTIAFVSVLAAPGTWAGIAVLAMTLAWGLYLIEKGGPTLGT